MEGQVLVAELADRGALARYVRAALSNEIAHVPLAIPPRGLGRFTLQLKAPGYPGVSVAAETAGTAKKGSVPLRLRPLDPSHIAELSAFIDEVSPSIAPPPPPSLGSSAILQEIPPLPRPNLDSSTDEIDNEVTHQIASGMPPHTASPESPPEDSQDLGPSVLFDPDAVMGTKPSSPARAGQQEDGTLTLPLPGTNVPPPVPTERNTDWKKTDPSFGKKHPADEDGISVVFGNEPTTPGMPTSDRGPVGVVLRDSDPHQRVTEDCGTLPLPTQGAPSGVPLSRASRRMRTAPPMSVGLGRIIANKYRLESVIGAGAVGAVYRASHGELGRTVAIKVLHPHCRADPHLLAAFRKEARAASLLDHPHVTIVHDFGEEPDGLVYIVMEYLPGITLQAAIDQDKQIAPKRAISIMLQVCGALSAAHERGIVHRDVKPDNVILVQSRDDEGYPYELAKVCDFGIAALEANPSSELTAGTPEYMAPEQALGRADPRTDVYACGVMLYEMLCGRPPFTGDSVKTILAKHAQEAPPRLSALVTVDARLEALILRALEKPSERRFQAMREMRQALKRLQT